MVMLFRERRVSGTTTMISFVPVRVARTRLSSVTLFEMDMAVKGKKKMEANDGLARCSSADGRGTGRHKKRTGKRARLEATRRRWGGEFLPRSSRRVARRDRKAT